MKMPSPSMIVAGAALTVALGGTGIAATQLARNSVGTPQLKNAAVTERKIADGAVTGDAVRDGSLSNKDFRTGALPRGARGEAGPQGAQGPKGDTGATGPTGPAGSGGAAISLSVQGAVTPAITQSILPAGWSAPVIVRYGTGRYRLEFARSLAGCVATGTIGMDTDTIGPAMISVSTTAERPEFLFVATADATGADANRPFRILLTCP